ncbi:hypothetical protein J3D55_001510 [Chryseobacterium ginsenosidimutans]|nr:hypothetical protein [Chryseobacterium ginsenosidimutans]
MQNLKNIKKIVFVALLYSCTTPKFYQGYIYSNEKQPLSDVKVCEINKNNCAITDSKGFF